MQLQSQPRGLFETEGEPNNVFHSFSKSVDFLIFWNTVSGKIMNDVTDTLDATGLLCPLPVLKARKRLKSLPAGSVLRVLTDDPAALIDIPHFCAEAGHTLSEQKDFGEYQAYLIRKEH